MTAFRSPRWLHAWFVLLLCGCVGKLWLAPLSSSFWVDETVTAFVVHYGGSHPSFHIAPQVPQSIYYALPEWSERWFGFSEVAYRAPSVAVMLLAVLLLGWIGRRIIHPNAFWFVVFGCFSIGGINYAAADARPYALGILIAATAVWMLVRWMSAGRVLDALLFVASATLLWRVHLIFWPFYLVLALYCAARLWRRETPVTWTAAIGVFALLGLSLLPVALNAIALFKEAKQHVIVTPPEFRDLQYALKFGLFLGCVPLAWLLAWHRKWERQPLAVSSGILCFGWWLIHPLCLFLLSRVTGNSVFVARYLSLALPGAVLGTAFVLARFLPSQAWHAVAGVLGSAVFLFIGHWNPEAIRHHPSEWRGAAAAIRQWSHRQPHMPVICPSPFIEARAPEWRPLYPLPSFLYAHLATYPVDGHVYLLPFQGSFEAEDYAQWLARDPLLKAGRFAIYGGDRNVHAWRDWFLARPELAGWTVRPLGRFGDVDAVLVESPAMKAPLGSSALPRAH